VVDAQGDLRERPGGEMGEGLKGRERRERKRQRKGKVEEA